VLRAGFQLHVEKPIALEAFISAVASLTPPARVARGLDH
jgi:hypothetical protein